MDNKTIVILGGGVGGLVAANELRRRLRNEHRVILVEKSPQHEFMASFPWLMVGDRQPGEITRALPQLLRRGVQLVQAEVRALNLARKQVETSAETLQYDYLIVALGAELALEAIPGLREAAHTFYTMEGSVKLYDTLQDFSGGRLAVVVAGVPYRCPGAPHEGTMLIADYLRRRGRRDKTEVDLYTPEAQPLPVAGPEVGAAVKSMLEKRGIGYHPSHKLTAVDPQARRLHFEGKEPVPYDLLVTIPPHRGSRVVREAGLANEAGWVPVDRATLKTKLDGVFAIGDCTTIGMPGRWKPDVPLTLPKVGVFAHGQAIVVACRLAAEIAATECKDVFCGDGSCMLAAGGGVAGLASGNFFAEPMPEIHFRKTGRVWHFGHHLFEQWWLMPFGLRRELLRLALVVGGRALRIPVVL